MPMARPTLGQGQGTEVFGTQDHGDGDDAGGHGGLVEARRRAIQRPWIPSLSLCALDVIHLGLASPCAPNARTPCTESVIAQLAAARAVELDPRNG